MRRYRSLFLTGPEMSPENEHRYIEWCVRWQEATGQRADVAGFVRKRSRGLEFPLREKPRDNSERQHPASDGVDPEMA